MIDLGDGVVRESGSQSTDETSSTNLGTGEITHTEESESSTDIDDGTKKTPDEEQKQEPEKSDEAALAPGTSIEVGDKTYSVDALGNVLDENGTIFKEAKDVKEWLDSFETVSNDEISIQSIQDAVGIEITDENDKPIEFENTPAGIKSYIDAVVESNREDNYKTAISTLYQNYPFVQDMLNYYVANGNSLKGYNEIPDRSNIEIDKDNEAQQEAIIRTAWEENGRKGNVNDYIAFLKSNGTLLASAEEELEALQESDKEYKERLAEQAEEAQNKKIAELEKYWNGVYDVIKSRNIAGYKIPDSIVISRGDRKLSVTPDDFYNYLYRTDKDGVTDYQKDLQKETPESRRDDEILRAYLKFVGGNYSNLVDMAINKEKVEKLKLRAKERNTSGTIRISKPVQQTNKEIDFGD